MKQIRFFFDVKKMNVELYELLHSKLEKFGKFENDGLFTYDEANEEQVRQVFDEIYQKIK